MQLFSLSSSLTIVLIIVSWIAIHLFGAFIGVRLPDRLIDPGLWLYRAKSWEQHGLFYERYWLVRKWKDRLPDGGSWMRRGFAKRTLQSNSTSYLEKFLRETCRAELTHLLMILPALLFFFWLEWWIATIMIIYALFVNLPCLVVQRYNRIRFRRVLERRSGLGQ